MAKYIDGELREVAADAMNASATPPPRSGMAPPPALLFSSSPSFRRVTRRSARVSTAFSLNRPSPLHSALLTIPRASQTEDHILPRPAVPTPTSTLPPPSTHQNTASDPRRAARSPADGMPPPQPNSAPRLALPAMARSQADLDFPSLISDLTSLLLHSPAGAASSSSGPVFSSSSLSIPTPTPKPKPNPSPTSATATPTPTPTPLARAAIGACAGAAAGAFTYAALLPIDAVKTRLQVQAPSATSWQVFLDILRTDGPLGLYRGLSAVILGSASSSAVYFGTCELAKSLLRPHLPPFLVPPLAGASGNVSSSAIMVPKELITQRLQSGAATGRSWQVLLGILRADGFFGLYAGYAATLLRNLPAGVLSYSSFEYLKAFTLKQRAGESLTPGESVLCGALAGAISAALTTPLDVVKTRLMTRVGAEGSRTVLGTMREVVAEEGLVGLSRGIGPRVLHSACFAALGYCAFETARLAILQCYLERCQIKAKAAAQPEVEPGVAAAAAT